MTDEDQIFTKRRALILDFDGVVVDTERVHFDLLQLAQAHSITKGIRTVLFHPGFPVDIRHNSKIGREELAQWAAKKMQE